MLFFLLFLCSARFFLCLMCIQLLCDICQIVEAVVFDWPQTVVKCDHMRCVLLVAFHLLYLAVPSDFRIQDEFPTCKWIWYWAPNFLAKATIDGLGFDTVDCVMRALCYMNSERSIIIDHLYSRAVLLTLSFSLIFEQFRFPFCVFIAEIHRECVYCTYVRYVFLPTCTKSSSTFPANVLRIFAAWADTECIKTHLFYLTKKINVVEMKLRIWGEWCTQITFHYTSINTFKILNKKNNKSNA